MGNCMGSVSNEDPSLSSTSKNNPPTPAGSTAGKSQFSDAVSEGNGGEATCPVNGKILEAANLKVFTLADLKSATKNFRRDTFLGEGGFGELYKGWIDEKSLGPSKSGQGMAVAIKKFYNEVGQSEINFLGRLSHPNLVKILGYCREDHKLLLVYEFMQKGSLEDHLFGRNRSIDPLSWDLRLKIAIGAARGLAFLHTSEEPVIYRAFKASNILLDGFFIAKMSDFGLAEPEPETRDEESPWRTMVTYTGYDAPEYIAVGHLCAKSDVYGFGALLLEVMTGLRVFDRNRPKGQHKLADWMRPILRRAKRVKGIMDPKIEGQYSSKAMLQAAQLTLKCLEPNPKNRPSMKEVVEVLQQIEAMDKKSKSDSDFHAFTGERIEETV